MTARSPVLISVDVGGTLGQADGLGLAGILAEASPLAEETARAIMRDRLHTAPAITDAVITDVCSALRIPESAFPRGLPPAPLTLFPGTTGALHELSQTATVVSLSNVTCQEADTGLLRALLGSWVSDYFTSSRIGYAKPDRRAFLAVSEEYGVPPEHMLHIGDDWECDVLGAVSVGIAAIWISRGRPVPENPARIDPNVLIADDLTAASHHVHRRRQRSRI